MTPSQKITAFLDEVKRHDHQRSRWPDVSSHEASCGCIKYDLGTEEEGFKAEFVHKETAEDFAFCRTAAPKMAEAWAFMMKSLLCLRLEVHGEIIDSIEKQIAAILTDEGKGE
jgi:hypothetical protein